MRSAAVLGLVLALLGCGSSDDDVAAKPLPSSENDATADIAFDDVLDPLADVVEPSEAAPDTKTADAKPDTPMSCRDRLTAEGVSFKVTTARGVVDAVNILGPLHGVLFASGTATTPMGDPVACEFALTLLRFADLAKSKGFVRIGTLGSYCYRCCCAWSTTNYCRTLSDPEPDCSADGYSNHSWGRAVDVRYLYKADGTRYDINDARHWVKYSTTETCTKGIAAQTGISKELYTLACEATSSKIFGIVLTPNYNDAHRNHLHMDIGRSGTPTSWSTKSLDPNEGIDDAYDGGDHCGDE